MRVEGARDIENKLWLSLWIVPITARSTWISASFTFKGTSYENPSLRGTQRRPSETGRLICRASNKGTLERKDVVQF